ncbi:DUF4403 family protein [uncultured Pseudacidovorax sp.]|uniref:DUF4403 family protein n=1 Tax=uncultured Pseudacidovorax sp. TaxID=679313 RepID=UPI0025F50828|nr:DUF4403 family protein [uncultured Pseudacidovorax sp.]
MAALTGCQTTLDPAAPKAGAYKPEPERQLSTVAMPVRMSAAQIQALAEAQFPAGSSLYWISGQGIGNGVDLQMGIRRAGPIAVATEGGCLRLGMELVLHDARLDWMERVGFIKVRKHVDFGGSARVSARVCPAVNSDWQLSATVEPSFQWVQGAYVNVGTPVGSFKIGVSERAEGPIREKLGSIGQRVNDALAALPLKQKLADAWTSVQQPIALNKQHAVYLVAEPTTLGMGPLVTEGTELVATPNLSAYLKVNLGKPAAETLPTPKPLPGNSGSINPKGISVSLTAQVPYDEANKTAEKALKDRPIAIGEKHLVKIHRIEVFPDGERLLVKAGFTGRVGSLPFDDIKGDLYLRGTPRYSNADRTLWVENLEFDVATKNLFVKAASVLANPILTRELEKALRFDLSAKLDPIIEKAKAGVSGLDVGKGVKLNAQANLVELDHVHIGPTAMAVGLNLKGNANIVLEPIKP